MRNPEFIIYTGPMASSKTSSLLMMLERFKYQNKNVVVFKPLIDDRYANAEIVSHNHSFRHSAVSIRNATEIMEYLMNADKVFECVVVDEAFMIPGIAENLIWLYRNGTTVVVSTLDISATGNVFPEVQDMLPWATEIHKLTAVCTFCGEDARYTHRKNISEDEIQVGGLDMYEPRCYKCCPAVNMRDYGN